MFSIIIMPTILGNLWNCFIKRSKVHRFQRGILFKYAKDSDSPADQLECGRYKSRPAPRQGLLEPNPRHLMRSSLVCSTRRWKDRIQSIYFGLIANLQHMRICLYCSPLHLTSLFNKLELISVKNLTDGITHIALGRFPLLGTLSNCWTLTQDHDTTFGAGQSPRSLITIEMNKRFQRCEDERHPNLSWDDSWKEAIPENNQGH